MVNDLLPFLTLHDDQRKTGEPVTTAMMEEGLDVYVITTDKKNLKLSPTMYAPELLKATEDVIKKDLISYLDK